MQCPSSSPPRTGGLLPGFAPSDAQRGPGVDRSAPKFSLFHDAPAKPDATTHLEHAPVFYPSPLPTSTHDAPSSPQGSPKAAVTVSETSQTLPIVDAPRTALSAITLIQLPSNGEVVTVGRSSKSSSVALTPSNKLISRVHAKVWYHASHLVVIECLGWNGLKVHVPHFEDGKRVYKEYPVIKNQTIYIEQVEGIMLDIHGDRALVEFLAEPPFNSEATELESETEDAQDDSKHEESDNQQPNAQGPWNTGDSLPPSSPGRRMSPELDEMDQEPQGEQSSEPLIEINESEPPVNPPTNLEQRSPSPGPGGVPTPERIPFRDITDTFDSKQGSADNATAAKRKLQSSGESGHSDEPELKPKRKQAKESTASGVDEDEVRRIVTNFVAFSRLNSVPRFQIIQSSTLLQSLAHETLDKIVEASHGLGIIRRTGKDALGQPLDPEYYYMVENDPDESRRLLVEQSKGTRSLRACRKTHKQYFYKKPKN